MDQLKCKTCEHEVKDASKIERYGCVFCSKECLDIWNKYILDPENKFQK
ncbi:MAG: hypothetical protein WCT36_04230 [Candidatus Gracilibacteria bacterium]|jgi:endogenous inhibitor of DNA gyrase (YacG/DUF329 family)